MADLRKAISCLFASVILVVLAACARDVCGAPAEVSEVPLLRLAHEEIVPLTLNGVPAGMVLDTGADRTILTPQAVADLGLPTYQTQVVAMGSAGATEMRGVDVARLRIGGGELRGAELFVTALSSASLTDFPIYGLLGDDILTNWDIDLDAAADRLTLYRPQLCARRVPPWPGVSQSLAFPSGLFDHVVLPVSVDGHDVTALLDTGLTFSTINVLAAGLQPSDVARDPPVLLRGIGQRLAKGRVHHFGALLIGGQSYGPATIVVTPPHSFGMVLGEDFLHQHRIYISFKAHALFIGAAPDRATRAVSARTASPYHARQ